METLFFNFFNYSLDLLKYLSAIELKKRALCIYDQHN